MLWLLVAALFLVTTAFVLSPLWRRLPPAPPADREPVSADDPRQALEEEKRSLLDLLKDLEEDLREGRITEEDHAALRESYEARALAVMAKLEHLPKKPSVMAGREPSLQSRRTRVLEAVVTFLLLAGVTGGMYAIVGGYGVVAQLGELEAQGLVREGQPDVGAVMARLEARLKEQPQDIPGHLLLARSYLALKRAPEAAQIYRKILQQDAKNVAALSGLGLAHLAMEEPSNALEAFQKALGQDPHAKVPLFYAGAILASRGDVLGARKAWTTLLDLLPPDSQDAQVVREGLQRLQGSDRP